MRPCAGSGCVCLFAEHAAQQQLLAGSAGGTECPRCSWSHSGPVLSASEWPPGPTVLREQRRLHLLGAADVGLPLVAGSELRTTLFKLAT